MERLYRILHALCGQDGIPNFEDAVREEIMRFAKTRADEVFADATGNVLVLRKGGKRPARPYLVSAHMDEPGFLVKEITADGYLHIESIDECIDTRSLLGKQIWVGAHRVPGIVALKAIHLTPKGDRDKIPEEASLSIDIGAKDREDAEKRVRRGDRAVPAGALTEMGDCLRGKGLDDRIGCAIALRMMEEPLPFDTWFVFGKKEIFQHGFGALLAARRLQPGFGLLLDCVEANDMPNVPQEKRIVSLRGGAALSLKGQGAVYNREINRALMAWAGEHGLRAQYVQSDRVRDAGQNLTAGADGADAVSISVPVRYGASANPVACNQDVEAAYRLSLQALRKAGEIHG